jgi:large subunit ribosomal protein L25
VSEISIKAEPRTEFGKGAARRIRRAAKVPAVLYGHGEDPVHVSLPGHDLMLALKNPNALLSITLDSGNQLALAKQVQRDPIKGFIEHADLILVRRGEKVTVEIQVIVEGTVESDAMVVTENGVISVEAEATHLPESVTVSVEGLTAGAQIHAAELDLPEGTTLVTDPDILVVNIVSAPTADELDAELAEAEAEAGIERDESDVDIEAAAEGVGEGAADGDGAEGAGSDETGSADS